MFRRLGLVVLEICIAVILLCAAVLMWASYYVDTDEFRVEFVDAVQEYLGQPVDLHGELNIAIYPSVSLEVLGLSVENTEASLPTLLNLEKILISIDFFHVFLKQIHIRSIWVDGAVCNFTTDSHGLSNWHQLISHQNQLDGNKFSSPGLIQGLSLDELEVTNARIVIHNADTNDEIVLDGIHLRTGAVGLNRDIPFTVTSELQWDQYGFGAEFIFKGSVDVNSEYELNLHGANISGVISGPFLPESAKKAEITAQVVMDWDHQSVSLDNMQILYMGLRANGQMDVYDFMHDFHINGSISVHSFSPKVLLHEFLPNLSFKSIDGFDSASLHSSFMIDQDGFSLPDPIIELDGTKFDGKFEIEGFTQPLAHFSLHCSALNVDKYFPVFDSNQPILWKDLGLSYWNMFDVEGGILIDELHVVGREFNNVVLALTSRVGDTDINISANNENGDVVTNTTAVSVDSINNSDDSHISLTSDTILHSSPNHMKAIPFSNAIVEGIGSVRIHIDIPKFLCAANEVPTDILKVLNATADFRVEKGSIHLATASPPYIVPFAGADALLSLKPIEGIRSSNTIQFDTRLNLNVKSVMDEAIELSSSGVIETALDRLYFKTSSCDVRMTVVGALYKQVIDQAVLKGVVSFDSDRNLFRIFDSDISLYGIHGKIDSDISKSDNGWTATGKIQILPTNLSDVLHHVEAVSFDMRDKSALDNSTFTSSYAANVKGLALENIVGEIGGTLLSGEIRCVGYNSPKLYFDLDVARLNIDRYLASSKRSLAVDPPSVDLPLSFLSSCNLDGDIKFQELELANLKVKNLTSHIGANNGTLNCNNIVGEMYGGKLTASWTGQIGQSSLTTRLKAHIEDLRAEKLMSDIGKHEYVRGESDLDFDLLSFGRTNVDLLTSLSGRCWVRVRNGSFKFNGYDTSEAGVTQSSRSLTSLSPTNQQERRTVFKRATADFTVKKGVFKMGKEQFRVEAPPVLQSYGSGYFSLLDDSINIAIRNEFIGVPSVTIELVGKLSDPEVKIPKVRILNDTVSNILSIPEKSFYFLRDIFK